MPTSAISCGVGRNLMRSCGEGQHSAGCREMQPKQFALQTGEVGMPHSQRR